MKKASLSVLCSLSLLAGAAYAQDEGGVTMSTDPAKAADVEQRAQALQSQQSAMPSDDMSNTGSMGKHHRAAKHGHHPMKHGKKAMSDKASAPAGASE
jgi:hypothetical protein